MAELPSVLNDKQSIIRASVNDDNEPYDLIGVGFGPTHIALAVAFVEEKPGRRALFLDSRDMFAWHPALLLPASRMQISFLKDLATFRNPQSSFSFVSYLHSFGVDRLAAFSNLGSWTPSRTEWAAYLAWAAARLGHVVQWSSMVLAVEQVTRDSDASLMKVSIRDSLTGQIRACYTRNLSLAPGATPFIPQLFQSLHPDFPEIAHTCAYLSTLQSLNMDRGTFEGRVAVIGGGQSSAEVFHDLVSRFPGAKVDMFYRASALVPADDSPFVNSRAFDPSRTDEFFGLSGGERMARLREFRRANYACIAPELIESMYKLLYLQRLQPGEAQHRIVPNTEVAAVERAPDGAVRLTLRSTLSTGGGPETADYDAVFLGTGYHRPPASVSFMTGLAPRFPALARFLDGEDGATLDVGRDYALEPADEATTARVFVLGFGETTHGLSETLLSVGAVRAGQVVRALYIPPEELPLPLSSGRRDSPLTAELELDEDDHDHEERGRSMSHIPPVHFGTLTPESEQSPERG